MLNFGVVLHDTIDCIERVQTKYFKYLLGVKNSTCSLVFYDELGRFLMYVTQHIRLIKYWQRLVNLSNNALVKTAYLTLVSLSNWGFDTWATKVQTILHKYNFSQYWFCNDLQMLNLLRNLKVEYMILLNSF